MHSRTPASFVCDFHAVCSYKFKVYSSWKGNKKRTHLTLGYLVEGQFLLFVSHSQQKRYPRRCIVKSIHSSKCIHSNSSRYIFHAEKGQKHISHCQWSRARGEKKNSSRGVLQVCARVSEAARRDRENILCFLANEWNLLARHWSSLNTINAETEKNEWRGAGWLCGRRLLRCFH